MLNGVSSTYQSNVIRLFCISTAMKLSPIPLVPSWASRLAHWQSHFNSHDTSSWGGKGVVPGPCMTTQRNWGVVPGPCMTTQRNTDGKSSVIFSITRPFRWSLCIPESHFPSSLCPSSERHLRIPWNFQHADIVLRPRQNVKALMWDQGLRGKDQDSEDSTVENCPPPHPQQNQAIGGDMEGNATCSRLHVKREHE